MEVLNKAFLLLNLFRKFDFLKLSVDFVVFGLTVSSISFEISSCSLGLVFFKLEGLNEGLLNPASLEDKDLNFGSELIDDCDGDVEGVDVDDCWIFGLNSGLFPFPLFKKLNLLNRPEANVDAVEGVVTTVVALFNVTFERNSMNSFVVA